MSLFADQDASMAMTQFYGLYLFLLIFCGPADVRTSVGPCCN